MRSVHAHAAPADKALKMLDADPMGLDNVAATIGEECGTIEDVIEPCLIQQGYLQRTLRGSIATARPSGT